MAQRHLPMLAKVSKLSNAITRILANNPGPFTLQGTNTYLLAGQHSSLLIDTGQGLDQYLLDLKPVLLQSPAISDIIITHHHLDHLAGLNSVINLIGSIQDILPTNQLNIWKFKLPDHQHHIDQVHLLSNLQALKSNHCNQNDRIISSSFWNSLSISWLTDGQEFDINPLLKLKIVHTPGHTSDSISCALYSKKTSTDPFQIDSIFVGDTLLGGSTTTFENLVEYLNSLNILSNLVESSTLSKNSNDQLDHHSSITFYPGHGQFFDDPIEQIDQIILHRHQRDQQIIKILSNLDDSSGVHIDRLVSEIYKDQSLPDQVLIKAKSGILQHLFKLKSEGQVEMDLDDSSIWKLSSS